ncbi:hypothetical protein MFIFM68171_09757 [Madurella fahalii]|uniref:Uncharacterized protein n=1 Tax=Madurella fahalii TaxID=1157608 RepID=A0ABQ0GP82_9PEZI
MVANWIGRLATIFRSAKAAPENKSNNATVTSRTGRLVSILGSIKTRTDEEKGAETAANVTSGGQTHEKPQLAHLSLDFLGPPNLQLNLSSGQSSSERKTMELFAVAVVALILQFSLLVVAGVAVYHQPTRDWVGYEAQPYGLPCYVIGSSFLFNGIALCSFVIENSAVEFVWMRPARRKISDKHNARLIWLQQSQCVKDQTFGSYGILSGFKRYVLTSSRQEDVKGCEHHDKERKSDGLVRRRKSASDATGALAYSQSHLDTTIEELTC